MADDILGVIIRESVGEVPAVLKKEEDGDVKLIGSGNNSGVTDEQIDDIFDTDDKKNVADDDMNTGNDLVIERDNDFYMIDKLTLSREEKLALETQFPTLKTYGSLYSFSKMLIEHKIQVTYKVGFLLLLYFR